MKIAIPIHGSRVMPRFGCTREMLIVTVKEGQRLATKRLTLTPADFVTLPALFRSEQVTVLICGGIHPRFQQALQGQQIHLVWGVVGEWEAVLQAYLNGTLQSDPAFCLCHQHRRGFQGGSRLRRGSQRRR
jgi:predicted Fe-Mo cluster-binding NifX family protein